MHGKNKASRKGEIMEASSCKKVLLIAQQSQNIGKVVLGQGSYLGYSVFQNFDEIALSCMVKETEAIWCFALFVTNLKINNDPHFWEG